MNIEQEKALFEYLRWGGGIDTFVMTVNLSKGT